MKTALVLSLLAVLLACKKPSGSAPTPSAAPSAKPWTPDADVVAFGEIVGGRVKPTGTDPTGQKLDIERFEVEGWKLVYFRRVKGLDGADSLHVEGDGGRCKRERFSTTWSSLGGKHRKLVGGPLDGRILREFQYPDGSCNLHFATRKWAESQDWGIDWRLE
jgi:hypothetical protein